MYFPMVGLLLPLAWGAGRLWNMNIRALKVSAVRAILVGAGALLVMGSIGVTRRYESHWRDTLTLLRYYLTQAPNDWKLHTRLGNEWIERRDYPSAIVEFREALLLNPNWAENHLNLGRALFTIGEYEEAGRAFATALQQTPNDWRAHILMGLTLSRQQDLESALREFRAAAQIAPRQAAPHNNVADTLARLGKLDEAVEEYRQTLRLDPRNRQAQAALDAITSRKP
jgi:Flp pilus assembly protein TadD